MQRDRIRHHTIDSHDAQVLLDAHALRLRPRESHELRIEASWLHISATATLRWHRAAEHNSVAIATVSEPADSLRSESEVLIQQYHQASLDVPVDPVALFVPFLGGAEEQLLLAPDRRPVDHGPAGADLLQHPWHVPLHQARGATRATSRLHLLQ